MGLPMEDGTELTIGDRFEVDGERGSFVLKEVRPESAEAYGGIPWREKFRSFPLSRVKVRRGRKTIRVSENISDK